MQPTIPIAENHIRISRSLFDEGMRAAESKAYRRTIQKLALILLALYLIAAFFLWYTGGSVVYLLGESVFLGALLFWLFVMLPRTKHRSKYNAMTQNENNIPERTVKFYQDHLTVLSNTGKETLFPYNDIQDWKETRHLYLLQCKNRTCVLLAKNGFTKGDPRILKNIIFHI